MPGLDLKSITAIGSGARSKFWMQMKSDILQIPYQNLLRSDLSTLGSAIIAGYSTGMFKDIVEIRNKFIRTNYKIYPNKDADKKYIKYIEVYKDLFLTLNEVYKKLSD